MPQLPNAHLAIIDEQKITHYLLASGHAAGRAKAAFFKHFGFTAAAWGILRDALLQHARSARAVAADDTPFGKKYIVEGPLRAPDAAPRGER